MYSILSLQFLYYKLRVNYGKAIKLEDALLMTYVLRVIGFISFARTAQYQQIQNRGDQNCFPMERNITAHIVTLLDSLGMCTCMVGARML